MTTCFIMMPMTTTAATAADYGGDFEHFAHVLDHLFVPAIEKAGYAPVQPSTVGSDVIQAHIIRSIQSADIVLCDITSLNANVFFELGIRTALNLPAVVVKDKFTATIPFDTGIVNHHTYDGSMSAWTLKTEIERLSQHILSSANSAEGSNSLWRYFGLAAAARPVVPVDSTEEKLDYALHLLQSLRSDSERQEDFGSASSDDADPESFIRLARSIIDEVSAKFVNVKVDGKHVTLDLGGFLITERLRKSVLAVASNYGVSATIVGEKKFV